MSIFNTTLRKYNIEKFRRCLENPDGISDQNFLYLFIGRTSSWLDDNNPPSVELTDEYLDTIRNEVVALKRIGYTNTCFVTKRIDWQSGAVYDEYAYDEDNSEKDFYVLTDDHRVYKCLDNNDGAQSTSKPASTNTDPFTLADGYRWKFMFNLSNTIQNLFLYDDWLPVPVNTQRTNLHQQVMNNAADDGSSPTGGHGFDPVTELFANNLIITTTITEDDDPTIPATDFKYRRYGLWINPRNSDNNLLDDQLYDFEDSNINIDSNSGYIIFANNRTPIERVADQEEKISVVISF